MHYETGSANLQIFAFQRQSKTDPNQDQSITALLLNKDITNLPLSRRNYFLSTSTLADHRKRATRSRHSRGERLSETVTGESAPEQVSELQPYQIISY